jgi:transposase
MGKSLKNSWGGRRNSYLTEQEEIKFLSQFEADAKKENLVSAVKIHEALEKRLGVSISFSTTTRLLERQGWKKVKTDKRQRALQSAKKGGKAQSKLKNYQSVWIKCAK